MVSQLITLYFATSTTLYTSHNLYPIVMTGLVNGVGIMSPMVMEEIRNRDIQRGVIETKHVYFRRNAIISPLQKCDNEKKLKNNRMCSLVFRGFHFKDNKVISDGHDEELRCYSIRLKVLKPLSRENLKT